MPGTLLNAALGLLPDRTVAVTGPDTLAAIVPMYNEETGAHASISALLHQETPPDQIALSINGGTDGTYRVATGVLLENGYRLVSSAVPGGPEARLEHWRGDAGQPPVVLISHPTRTAKSESINRLVGEGLVTADRLLILDGDTVLTPGFITELRNNFYRLRETGRGEQRRFVLEDYGLVSGSVCSARPPAGAGQWQQLISRGRGAEYATSMLLRRGQARQLGEGRLFGSSRVFTVVGCGFAARRGRLPLPLDSRTEDHEFTLLVQNTEAEERFTDPAGHGDRGFRVGTPTGSVPLHEYLPAGARFSVRRSGNVRFVPGAAMFTEDPALPGSLLGQVERWNGGGQEGALKRLGTRLRPNVAWTVWLAQLENLTGIFLLFLLLPNMIAANFAHPGFGVPLRAAGSWLLLDAVLTFLLSGLGFAVMNAATGRRGPRGILGAAGQAAAALAAYLFIRLVNPLAYVAALFDTVPAWWRSRHAAGRKHGVAWERPRGRRGLSPGVRNVLLSVAVLPVITGALLVPLLFPVNAPVWEIVHTAEQLKLEDYTSGLPPLSPAPAGGALCGAGTSGRGLELPRAAEETAYDPLGTWDLLALARLAPLLPLIEQAAAEYRINVQDLLLVFMNESLFDPLAVGPTGDLGLAQLTGDALTLLRTVSRDPSSAAYGPGLIDPDSNVFDPVFASCAGAAKLAWAWSQPRVSELSEAYALYINPVHGFAGGRIGRTWEPLVAQLDLLRPNVQRMASVYAQYGSDPARLPAAERKLVETSLLVADGLLDMRSAYERAREVIHSERIDDLELYDRVLNRLYGPALALND